jgi:hypothetical protein
VGRVAGDQREAGEEGEADDHAHGDDAEAPPLARGRARRPDGGEVRDGERARDGRAPERDDPRVEALQRELRRGEGERERGDPEHAEQQARRPLPGRSAARGCRRRAARARRGGGGLRYRRGGGSVIAIRHA